MIYPVYSYRDKKVGFMMPQCDQSDQSAMRGFAFAINQSEGIMNFAPGDFDLYKIGEFDTEKGTVIGCTPELICSGDNVYGVVEK